jgi:threonine/homoserine/homoserine lactone efflux protein
MLGIEHYPLFLASGILLNLTPGQDTVYVVGRSAAQGRRAGLASAFGIGAGSVVHTFAAAFGLSYVLMQSSAAFEAVRLAGAAYLAFLGIRMLFTGGGAIPADPGGGAASAASLFRKGMLTNLLNPKVALFFLSFLPQFIDPGNPYGPLPFLLLGLTFVATGTAWCCVLALSAARFSRTLRSRAGLQKMLHRLAGGVFILLGIRLALRDAA